MEVLLIHQDFPYKVLLNQTNSYIMKLTLTFLLFAPTLLFAQIPSQGLVGHWSFNGNANDKGTNAFMEW